ncbi:MAG: hypothetical protein PF961_21055 [Planctomycetota bacterium]|jgi:hypothetical protein|nr:hypothetical protein [Planctomycetota bacterium]
MRLLILALVSAASLFAVDPHSAVTTWRQLQYAGDAESVIADLAPAAPGFVDSKSNAATRDNVKRMTAGVYGFEVLTAKADGDAGVATLLVAWTDKDGPKVIIMPFFMWKYEGRWTYLPNPIEVETWYQSVPDELEPGYERLRTWHKEQEQANAHRLKIPAADLITMWREQHR